MRTSIKYIVILSVFTNVNARAEIYLAGKLGSSIESTVKRQFSVGEYNVSTKEPASAEADLGHSSDSVMFSGIGVGYNFKKNTDLPFRLEVEYVNRQSTTQLSQQKGLDFDLLVPNNGDNELSYSTKTKSQQLMLNGYLDYYTKSGFNPFINIGIGRTFTNTAFRSDYRVFQNRGTIESSLESKMKYAWSIGMGLSKEIDEDWLLNLGYSFTHIGKLIAEKSWVSNDFGFEANLKSESKLNIQYHDLYFSLVHKF